MNEIIFYIHRRGNDDLFPYQCVIHDGVNFIKDNIKGFYNWATIKNPQNTQFADPAIQLQHKISGKRISKDIPNVIYLQAYWLDIDTHSEKQKENLIKDFKVRTVSEAINKLLKSLKNDPFIFFAGKSKSAEGLHIVILLENVDQNNKSILNADSETLTRNHRYNSEIITDHLIKNHGIKIHGAHWKYATWDTDSNYIDAAPLRNMVQSMYRSIPDPLTVLNYNPQIFKVQVLPINVSKKNSTVNVAERDSDNQRFINLVMAESDGSFLKDALSHHEISYIFAIQGLAEDQRRWFYNLYVKYYKGKSIPLQTFEIFDQWVYAQKNRTYAIDLEDRFDLLDYRVNVTRNLFGYPYDKVITIKTHASEARTEVKKIINKHDRVIIDAEPAVGKTTMFRKLMADLYHQKPRKYSCYTTPKNIINDQIYELMKTDFPEIPLYRNYSDSTMKHLGADDKTLEHFVYISSNASLHKIIQDVDILLVDEVQDLVNYAELIGQRQIEFPSTVKQVFFSATPETFMVGGTEGKYFTVKIVKENDQKQKIDLISVNNILEYCLDFIRTNKNKNILIYYNDKTKCLEIQDTLAKENITVGLINADTKGSIQNRMLIEKQMIPKGIWLGTDLINSGINILNPDIDYVLMLTDHHKDIFKIEQFPARIRNKQNTNIILATVFNYPQITFGDDWRIEKENNKQQDGETDEHFLKRMLQLKDDYRKKRIEQVLSDPIYQTVLPIKIRERLDRLYEAAKLTEQAKADYYNSIGESQFDDESPLNEDFIYIKNKRVEINKNRIKNKIVQDAMELITNHPVIYKHYLSKIFAIKWLQPYSSQSEEVEKRTNIFFDYPEEITSYVLNFQGKDSDFVFNYPHMKPFVTNIQLMLSVYSKLAKKYIMAKEFKIDFSLIKNSRFENVYKAKLMESFKERAPITIIDKVKKKVYNDLWHLMYFDIKFEPQPTEMIFKCLKEDSQEYFLKVGGNPLISLGKFIHTYIESIDQNWVGKRVIIDGKKVKVWRYKKNMKLLSKVESISNIKNDPTTL